MRLSHSFSSFALPPIATVDFMAQRLRGSQVLWSDQFVNGRLLEEQASSLLDQYSYLIPGGPTFDRMDLDAADSKLFSAERYGGEGISDNGGGVRVAVLGDMQIKGVGQNPLVGGQAHLLHSYGGLNAMEAAYEKIYTEIANHVLPLGAVGISTIIATSADGAYPKGGMNADGTRARVWGALLVRQNCLRMGHFVRAGRFAAADGPAGALPPDVARVRAINRALLTYCKTAEAFIEMISVAITRHAHQFAAARVTTLSHGALSSSNISMDGRWLDLARASFVPSQLNTGGSGLVASEDEPSYFFRLLKEMLFTFEKYNKIELGIDKVGKFYDREFSAATRRYAGFLLGIDAALVAKLPQSAWDIVARCVYDLLRNPKVRDIRPASALEKGDIACVLADCLFQSIDDASAASVRLTSLCAPKKIDVASLLSAFAEIARHLRTQGEAPGAGPFLPVQCFIKSKKRSMLREFFLKRRLDDRLERCSALASVPAFAETLAAYLAVAQWVFTKRYGDSEVIFDDGRTSLFCRKEGVFLAADGGEQKIGPGTLSTIAPGRQFVIEGYDFSRYIAEVVEGIERMTDGRTGQ